MDRFIIAPFESGLQLNLPPWLIMDDAFFTLNNVYAWRGRLRKRFGAQYTGNAPVSSNQIPLYSRLSAALSGPITINNVVGVGVTDGTGNATNPLPGDPKVPWGEYRIGQYFMIGADKYTIAALGTPTILVPSAGAPAIIHTFNTTTGVYVFTNAAINSQVFFYPNAAGYSTDAGGDTGLGVISGVSAIGQAFSIGNDVFTIVVDTPNVFADMLSTNPLAAGTFNFTTGQFQIVDVTYPLTQVYFYPAQPVMGLTQYNIGVINNHPAYAFDTEFVYVFGNRWLRTGPNVQFHGDDTQFFWTYNYIEEATSAKALFATNFNATVPTPDPTDDPIWYLYNGVWDRFQPVILPSTGAKIVQALVIVFFKGRLILLNTVEQALGVNYSYPNRCRYSQFGSAFDVDAFVEQGEVGFEGGGQVDATTDQAIVSAEFIKDRLIVYFERQTYELAYTGNQITPFVWQKLNTELGSQSTYSTVPFDNAVLTIGNTGIHSCNGSNVQRIDQKLPDNVFEFALTLGDNNRICGIRDYYTELVYWCFLNKTSPSNVIYPNQVLVYNYQNATWAYFDDTITTFGYFEQSIGIPWSQYLIQWQEWTAPWNSGVAQPGFRQVIAGNQEGFVFQIDDNRSRNAAVIQITDMTYVASGAQYIATITAINHNLVPTQYIVIEDYAGQFLFGFTNQVYEVINVIDVNHFTITTDTNPVYNGNAYFRTVSRVNFQSKQWNPYVQQARDVYISKLDFAVSRTVHGEVTVDYYASSQTDSTLQSAAGTGTLLGTGNLSLAPYPTVTRERNAERLWHPIYLQNEGECIQIHIYYSDLQMLEIDVVDSDFEMEGMVLHCMPTTTRLE